MNPQVDEFIANSSKWFKCFEVLRPILLDCGLTEMFKWKQPCYTLKGKNVIIMSNLKDYCTLSFLKGALLKDTNNLLIKPGEHSQATRYLKFTNPEVILEHKSIIKTYIFEAIEIEKAGIKLPQKKESKSIPEELLQQFDKRPELKKAFESLTPGRQRGYILHFSAPKQSKTKTSRIEKCIDRILDGKGFHDCVCGHSKRMPTCDGSHKFIK